MNTAAAERFHLVSVGIGDVDNITRRAERMIGAADVVFGMDFVVDEFAELLVGKEVHNAGHGLFSALARRHGDSEADIAAQEDKVRTRIRSAHAAGERIVVLEFGDPMIYGPQSGYLREFADLQPQVVAGVSSFNAANAALARPLLGVEAGESLHITTLRGLQAQGCGNADVCVVFTMRMDWQALQATLQQHYRASTPVALVMEAGFRARETVLHTSVGALDAAIAAIEPPWACLVYVGAAVGENAANTGVKIKPPQ